jgi:hypothetical protein
MEEIKLKPPKNAEIDQFVEETERIRNRTGIGQNDQEGKF